MHPLELSGIDSDQVKLCFEGGNVWSSNGHSPAHGRCPFRLCKRTSAAYSIIASAVLLETQRWLLPMLAF